MIKIKDYKFGKEWIDCLVKSYILDFNIADNYKIQFCKIMPVEQQGQIYEANIKKKFLDYLKEEQKEKKKFSESEEVKKLESQLNRLWSFGYTILPHELQEFKKYKTLKLWNT